MTVSGRTVEVVDHGNGYPEELIAEGPRRFRSGTAERGVGHGLGLTIAAGHAKVLGAELTFGEAPGGGALARLVCLPSLRRSRNTTFAPPSRLPLRNTNRTRGNQNIMRTQFIRRSAAAVAGLALAGGGLGIAGALQANAATTYTTVASASVAAKSITIKSDKATAKAWAKVSFTGKTSGIAKNTVVQVQRLERIGKWVNFPATTKVTSKAATYSVWVQSGRVGVNKFRVVSAGTASAAASVTITK